MSGSGTGATAGDTERLVAALADPAFHGHGTRRVEHLQTHLSHVFVAPPFAYKLKKPVRFSFVDQSTAALRRALGLDEVRLNRRLCAPLYLGVVPVERHAGGRLALGRPLDEAADAAPAAADGRATAIVDHLVWMRSLPAEGMARHALAAGRIDASAVAAFARALARFHAATPPEPADSPAASPDAVERRWMNVLRDAEPVVGRLLSPEDRDVLADFGPSFVRRHESLLEARARAGRVREGHGDLHLGNLCLVEEALDAVGDAPPVPPGLYAFDCLEFSRELRVNDVASEVAFLAMDLEASRRDDLARALVAAYADAARDPDLDVVLPLFVAYRAAVRGMVHGLAMDEPETGEADRAAAAEAARSHFALALRTAWRAAGPAIVACAGLSGSGKTTVATALAATTGFRLLSSDEIRKRRAGLDPHAPAAGASALYAAPARRKTYEALAEEARRSLARGEAVIADATFNRAAERDLLAAVARSGGHPLLFVECRVDEATALERLRARAAAPPVSASAGGPPARSDADAAIRAQQVREHDPLRDEEPHVVVDTSGSVAEVRARALRALWAWRRDHGVRRPPPPPHAA